MIDIVSISKFFNGKVAVDQISLQAKEGEVLVLLGTSGCGKTTTLKMINRLIEPDKGQIFIAGKDIRERDIHDLRRQIGFVMQHAGLFPHYTVARNIAVVPELLKWEKKTISLRTAELLHKLNLGEEILQRYPHELSGGQQQRVGIARALIADSPILLMDEPFGALDNITKADIHAEFRSLEEIRSKTIILVTHDVSEAFELGQLICLMDKGKIVQIGTPKELLYRPANEFVANFFAENRLLLEYKVTTLQELQGITAIDPFISRYGFTLSTDLWHATQVLSMHTDAAQAYETLVGAFNNYRKQQVV
ncbi:MULTISPECIES: ABC transporter ATP-binding protein [Sphingobacterium]|uniref:ABC transporter ATP-binding protein n=1 Tax=Sphingobacterium TaxID=28453 RepID=UPI000965E4FA|nr:MULTISPECIES: ABC transporter ATP-binding protein [Sphingobacterium]OJZ15896.1 MAG: glycine/betaine ABC transporter ATP-binding protein [Sphingobacterium sp. 40-24]HAK31735.1 glycine/betaine ABC transporter ATP-binding protein [Sphingobacterium sp.]